jgi:hydroxymethylglutaryl-CoA lyase
MAKTVTRQPDVHPRGDLSGPVTVYEVGPRDGLQNEANVVPTEVKAEFVRRLVDAGLRTVEATSFVSPRWVPQLADAEKLMGSLPRDAGARYPVLVPNMAGLDRAVEAGASHVAVFASATEAFARRNLNRSLEESLQMFAPVVGAAKRRDMWVRGYVSMAFGDPWEGTVAPAQVAGVAGRLFDQGCDEVCVGDTIGVATPGHVGALLEALYGSGVDAGRLGVHFHDTYGQALANTLAALEAGVRTVDSSAGGLGGCPYAESATGNLATEDLVWMLHGLGLDTGVDLAALAATSRWMAAILGRPSPSRVVNALGGGGEG